jgi:type VI secretion system FHA domain protein
MALKLTLKGGSDGRGQTRVLSSGTLTLGRGTGNDWVLPDPDRYLSKTHCVVSVENGRYILTDLSKNGVHINGALDATQRDSRTVLTDGDEVRLGPYIFAVGDADDTEAERRGAAEAGALDPRFRGDGGPLDVDPLDDPLGRATSDPAFPYAVRHAPTPRRPEDAFDLADERNRRSPEPGEDLFRGVAPPGAWRDLPQADNVDAPLHAFAAPRVLRPDTPRAIDVDALIGDLEPLLSPHLAARPPPPPIIDAPVATAPSVTPAPAPPSDLPAAPSAGCAAGLGAFLAGAGVPGLAAGAAHPDAMLRGAGEVFRMLADGLRELLISRALIKDEMRVERTMIRARDNNPLKFCATADEAVAALLASERAGYLSAQAAAREATSDMKSHEVAMMVGLQAAFSALLRRFDPDALESRMARGVLGNVLPAARKARYWDGYRQLYREITREAEDDFQAVFGRTFANAYEAQTRND